MRTQPAKTLTDRVIMTIIGLISFALAMVCYYLIPLVDVRGPFVALEIVGLLLTLVTLTTAIL